METNPFVVQDYIRNLAPYIPGKPIEETKREYNLKKVIKLASNENPLGPSPKAVLAMKKAVRDLHRYPDSGAYHLKQSLSKRLGVSTAQLIFGNGSNEVIDQLIRTFCVPGDAIVTSQAAFIAYKICAQVQGVRTVEVPLREDLKFEIQALVNQVKREEKCRLVFLANPNNPTGTYLNKREMTELLDQLQNVRAGSTLVVLDYAYWEYVTESDLPDPMDLLKKYPNVVVLRTFSKIYGLAGLRVGYGIASSAIIADVEKTRQPFNNNSLALAAAEAALADTGFVKRARDTNKKGLLLWERELEKIEVPFWKSQGNFVLIDSQRGFGQSGPSVYQECLKRGVIFRPVANYGLMHALRITVGTMDENERAIGVLKTLKKAKGKSL